MKLIKYKNEHYEEERALFDLTTNKTILMGDYYHDKIDERIDGYLEALSDHNIYTAEVVEEWINSSHEYYQLIGFYNEEGLDDED